MQGPRAHGAHPPAALPLRRRRAQRGQAMPLAAIGLFIMCLGILATLNLGQAVHQKIRLQNTADSAAYTLAAMEARTFNYIALLNRAQIAHYNTAMMVQSYMTWVGYQVAMFGTATDLLGSLRNAFQRGFDLASCYPPNAYILFKCPFGFMVAILNMWSRLAEGMRDAAVNLYRAGEDIGHQLVEAMSIFNARTMWQSQFFRAGLLNTHILTGMRSYIHKLDPDVRVRGGPSVVATTLFNILLNAAEYSQAFDRAAGLNPAISLTNVRDLVQDWRRLMQNDYMLQSSGGVAGAAGTAAGAAGVGTDNGEAIRVMAELTNASRSPSFVSDRRNVGSSSVNATAFVQLTGSMKLGQTKLTTSGRMFGASIQSIRTTRAYPAARYLSSDDYTLTASGTGTAGPGNITWQGIEPLGDAIAAYESRGSHRRYRGPRSGGGAAGSFIAPRGTAFSWATITPQLGTFETQRHAPWPGFSAYFKFNARDERTADFNQPSTWIYLNKHHRDFQSAAGSHAAESRAPWYSNFSFTQGERTANLDTRIGGPRNAPRLLGIQLQGLNVISRAMAYYHRPGNWTEHPNFFNPFWRARLAPVAQKMQALWERTVSSNITTGSSNMAWQAAVNFMRNAQADLFTALITGLCTH